MEEVKNEDTVSNKKGFVIRRKKVRFPTFQPRVGSRWCGNATLEDELNMQIRNYPGRITDVWIAGVKFKRLTGWTANGNNLDVSYGFAVFLWNMAKAMKSMGYKDYVDNSTLNGGDYRYPDTNEGILNLIHIMFKDYKIPHILDSQEDEDEDNLALPLIQQLQGFNLAQQFIPNNSPNFDFGPASP